MPQQLRMIFDCALTTLPALTPPAGFRVRAMQPGEEEAYLQLRRDGGFASSNWSLDNLNKLLAKALPDGLFLAVDEATGALAASAAAEKSDYEDHPELGCLGWVMASEVYRGRQLGKTVSIAAMHHLAQHGYQKFALKTDDWRLPAVNMYLKLGWKPWLFDDDMPGRWQALCQTLQIDESHLITFNRDLQACHS